MTDSPPSVANEPPTVATQPPAVASQPPKRRPIPIIVAALVVVGLVLWSWLGRQSSHGGPDTSITLVTSDHDDLACASEQSFGRYRCEFRAPGVPWPTPPAPADRLVGYYTVDQKLYVIPGLFEQPALAARYASEESHKLPRDQRARFSADCQLKVTDRMTDFQTRWLKDGGWNHQDEAPVATASDCRIP
jgi:hypothetical protein